MTMDGEIVMITGNGMYTALKVSVNACNSRIIYNTLKKNRNVVCNTYLQFRLAPNAQTSRNTDKMKGKFHNERF